MSGVKSDPSGTGQGYAEHAASRVSSADDPKVRCHVVHAQSDDKCVPTGSVRDTARAKHSRGLTSARPLFVICQAKEQAEAAGVSPEQVAQAQNTVSVSASFGTCATG